MMRMVRVYFPLMAGDLRALAEEQQLPRPRLEAYAVTSAVQREQPGEDPEVLEYGALHDAALASAVGGRRMLVAAADVEQSTVHEQERGVETAIVVDGPVHLDRIVSLHLGDPDADSSGEDDVELSWYDVTELAQVRVELG